MITSFLNLNPGTLVGLRAWMEKAGLSAENQDLGLHDAAGLAEVRDGLRGWIGSGGAPSAQALEAINRVARAIPMTVTIDGSGTTGVGVQRGSAVERAIGAVLAAVHDSVSNGTWRRLKVCRGPGCGWVFYDLSRNRSGVWCEMAVCGNREKARRYRARRRRATEG